jgi:hypothetical protein
MTQGRMARRSEWVLELVIPKNLANTKLAKGVENLFPPALFEEHFYRKNEKKNDDGGKLVVETLDKTQFCD